MSDAVQEPIWLDYFSGGVPTGEYFRLTIEGLRELAETTIDKTPCSLVELCYIGLVSYFEAFCKDHFASIINILPSTAINLQEKGQDTTLDVTTVLRMNANIECQLGFLLAEKYDFGSAQKVNALYAALLMVTPFSKDEALNYERILRDRNLLVHHGGIFTSSYLQQASSAVLDPERSRPFSDSLVVTKEYFLRDLEFFESIVRKILKSTHAAANRIVSSEKLVIGKERQKAIDAFL